MAKYENIRALAKKQLQAVTESSDRWKAFLRTAAIAYNYSFPNQLLIHEQSPTATAVADIAYWNNNAGRWVKRGAHGIAVFDTRANSSRLRYLFDISDTIPRAEIPEALPWVITDQNWRPVWDKIVADNHADSIQSALLMLSTSCVAQRSAMFTTALGKAIDGSSLQWAKPDEQRQLFIQLITQSCLYMAALRCGVDTARLDLSALESVNQFDTNRIALCLGSACQQAARPLMQQIGSITREIDSVARAEKVRYYGDKQEETNNTKEVNNGVHDGERLPNPGADAERAADAGNRQVRQPAAEFSAGERADGVRREAKALLLTMIREANAGEEVRGVNERQPKSQNKTEDERWNSPWPGMLFSDYLEFWLQWKRKSWEEVTYSGYCQNVRSWIEPYFAKRKVRLNEITVLDIEMFYTHEINQRGVSGNTVLHYHANIRKALSDAAKLKLIPYNPAAEVERPKKDNFVASYYSADELMEVLPIFANTKMELPVMLAAFYGLRRSEVIGLQWSAIDFERKIVTISRTFERINVDGKMVDVSKCRTKNKASFRSLPLIPAVEQALLKAQKRQHQQMKLCGGSYCKEYKDYICVDDMGHLVTPDYVTRVFREMLLKNGFRPIRYHDLRHSCASLLIKNKVTMKEVQMWLGHSSFSTTANIYAHIDVDSKMEAANMIASKINLGELPEKKKSPKRKIA